MRQLKCTSKNPEDSTFIKAMRVNLYQNVRKIEFKLAHSEGHSVQDKFFKIRIPKKAKSLESSSLFFKTYAVLCSDIWMRSRAFAARTGVDSDRLQLP